MTYESLYARNSRASRKRTFQFLTIVLVLAASMAWACQGAWAQSATTDSQDEAYPASDPTPDVEANANGDPATATPYPGIADLRAAAARARSAADTTYRWPYLTVTIWFVAGALLLLWVMLRERHRSVGDRAPVATLEASSTGAPDPPPPGTAYLQPLDLPGEPRYFALAEPGVTIGAADDGTCDIVVDHATPGFETMAETHASIEVNGRVRVLIDQHSEHGVFVNGQRVGECLLGEDCRVSFGAVRFSFVANERKGDE